MPITFLNPGVLLGALAAVLPVLIHLLSRRRVRRRVFSDLRFLEQAQASRARSVDLKRWLLLLLRVLVILLVVLGAARPRLGGASAVAAGPRSLLLVLDGSASMQARTGDGSRFAAAAAAAADLVGALPAGSEVQALVAGAAVAPLFGGWVPASEAVADALRSLAPGDGPFPLPEALRAAAGWVGAAGGAQVQLVLLSDLQGWDRRRGSPAAADSAGAGPDPVAAAATELAAAGPVRALVRGVGEAVPNGGVLGSRLPLRAVRAGEPLTIGADVLRREPDQVFRLELDGRIVAEAVAAGAAGGRGLVEFALAAPEPGRHRGRVLAGSDLLPADDVHPFVLEIRARMDVLLVHGADRQAGGPGRGGWRYLAEALGPGGREELFRVRAVESDRLVAGDLAAADVVLLVDPDPLGRELLGELSEWLRGGGAAAFLLGDPGASGYFESVLLPALGLPARADFRSRPAGSAETVTILEPAHPIFAGLGERPLQTLQEVRWRRFHAVDEGEARVLAAFAGGAPALLEGDLGAGTFLLLPFDLSEDASELAPSPMALPLLQRLTAYLEGRRREGGPGGLLVGERPQVRLRQAPAGTGAVARGPVVVGPGPEPPQPAELAWRGGVPTLVGPVAARRGFYAFVADGDTVGLAAAAVPAAESDPAVGDPGALAAALRTGGLAVQSLGRGDAEAAAGLAVAAAGREISMWLFGLAFLLLCVELFVGRGGGGAGTSP